MEIFPIAHIKTDYKEKFGIPHQSCDDSSALGYIIFEPQYRNEQALRGIEDFSHLWIIFDFSLSHRSDFSPTVRPPRLGGNTRMGVFATRSPFRPNSLGLSSVRLVRVEHTENDGSVLVVAGADMLDGTPIYDIKPYLPYADCHTDATGGFTDSIVYPKLDIVAEDGVIGKIPEEKRNALFECLRQDPRPSYQNDFSRIYSMRFSNYDIHFKIENNTLTIVKIDEKE